MSNSGIKRGRALGIPVGIILAAGIGRRLQPLTIEQPKAMVLFCNRPLLEYQIDTLKQLNVQKILVLVNSENENHILSYIKEHVQGLRWNGMDVETVNDQQSRIFGMEIFEHLITSHFALLDCDRLFTEKAFTDIVAFHYAKRATCTWLMGPAQGHAPSNWWSDNNGCITYYQKIGTTKGYEHTGIILGTPDFIQHMVHPTEDLPFFFMGGTPWYGFEPQSVTFWEKAPELYLNTEAGWYAYNSEGYTIDVGTPAGYFSGHIDALIGRSPFMDRSDVNCVAPHSWVHPTASIDASAQLIPPYFIGQNVCIESAATVGPFAIVGDDTRVEAGAKVSESILWWRVTVPSKLSISRSVIASGVRTTQDTAECFIAQVNDNIVTRDISEDLLHVNFA